MSDYEVSLHIEVHDSQRVYEEAQRIARGEGIEQRTIDAMFLTDGEINVATCVQFVADPGKSWPGTQIVESEVSETMSI
jgi:hypothetical protein